MRLVLVECLLIRQRGAQFLAQLVQLLAFQALHQHVPVRRLEHLQRPNGGHNLGVFRQDRARRFHQLGDVRRIALLQPIQHGDVRAVLQALRRQVGGIDVLQPRLLDDCRLLLVERELGGSVLVRRGIRGGLRLRNRLVLELLQARALHQLLDGVTARRAVTRAGRRCTVRAGELRRGCRQAQRVRQHVIDAAGQYLPVNGLAACSGAQGVVHVVRAHDVVNGGAGVVATRWSAAGRSRLVGLAAEYRRTAEDAAHERA